MTIVTSNSLTLSNINDGTDAPTIFVKSYTFSAGSKAYIEITGPNAFKQTVYNRGHNVWVLDVATHKLKEFVSCDTYTAMSFIYNGISITFADYLASLTDSIVVIAASDADRIDQDTRNVLDNMGGSPELGTWGNYRTGHVFIGMSKRSDGTWPLQPRQGYEEAIQKDGSSPEIGCTLSNGGIVVNGATGPKGDRGDDGIAGKDGVGLKNTIITYGISASDSTMPGTWSQNPPALVKGQWFWTKTQWTYTDNSTETGYQKTYIAKDGNNGNDGIAGKDGTGIRSTTITYVGSTSGTTVPTSGWASTIPTVAAGSYLWTKTVWTYTDNTSETGYSVAKMGNDGATGPAGPPGSNGNPGKIVSNTEPTTKFNGLTWKYSGANDITASDGTNILAGTEYYWNGTVWALYEINAHNINGDNLSVTNGTFKDGKIESVWGSNGVNGTTTIEGNHLQIHSTNSVSNTENTVALDNEQGYAQVYVDKKTGRTITVQVSSQGFFVSDSTGPYVSVTPTGIVNSVDVSWTTIGSYAAYRRDGRVVTIRVVGAKTSTAGNIYIGTIPLKDCPAASVMGDAIAWSASVTNDKHIQINGLNQQNSGSVTILSAAANQEYTFQFTYQI